MRNARTLSTTIALLAAVSHGAYAQAAATVSPTLARFLVPVGRPTSGLWQWYDAATSEGTAEYRWHVRIEGDTARSIGFMLFKLRSPSPREGTFAELLRAGQADLILISGHRERVVRGVRPVLTGQDSALVVELRDSSVIAAMFALRPGEVTFEVMSPMHPMTRSTVRIQYVRF